MSDIEHELTGQLIELNERASRLEHALENTRAPSKAHLIGTGAQFDPRSTFTADDGPFLISAIAKARSTDHQLQEQGKAELEILGSTWAQSDAAKATLTTTSGAGAGYLVPNALLGDYVEVRTSANPFRKLLNVIGDVRALSVQIPSEGFGPTRAAIVVEGATKPSVDFTLANYSATLFTLARIHDVSNQLLRHSAGAADKIVRSKLVRAMAQGEAYYIINGSGTNEPKGLNTSLAAGGAVYTSSNTASDSTVAGSVRAAVARMIEALALRNVEATAIVMNSGDFAHMFVQGADAAGFWTDETGGTQLLGLPVVTTTAIASKTCICGDFRQAELYLGDDFRIDVSSEAGTRWDTNLTGFRGEEELGFNADPYVLSGYFQRCTTLIP